MTLPREGSVTTESLPLLAVDEHQSVGHSVAVSVELSRTEVVLRGAEQQSESLGPDEALGQEVDCIAPLFVRQLCEHFRHLQHIGGLLGGLFRGLLGRLLGGLLIGQFPMGEALKGEILQFSGLFDLAVDEFSVLLDQLSSDLLFNPAVLADFLP